MSTVSHETSGKLFATLFLVVRDKECYFASIFQLLLWLHIAYYIVDIHFRLWSKLRWLLLTQGHSNYLNRVGKIWKIKEQIKFIKMLHHLFVWPTRGQGSNSQWNSHIIQVDCCFKWKMWLKLRRNFDKLA